MRWIPPQGSPTEIDKISFSDDVAKNIIIDTEMVSDSEEETFLIGKRIAEFLTGGSTVALTGTLGSGKTILTKGIASGLGVKETITSPTYTIISEYSLPDHIINKKQPCPALYHIDAYRLNNEEDFEQIGGSEIINAGGITIIEWSERIQKSLPRGTIFITLEITGLTLRLIKVKADRL